MPLPRLLTRRMSLPIAALLGLGLGALASSCGHQPPGFDSGLGEEYGERLAARLDNPAPPPVYDTPPEGWVWTAWLPEFLPAVTACLAAAAEPEAVAVQAWPIAKGQVGVHLRGPDGTRWECVAPDQGMNVSRLDRLPDDYGPEGPVFAPAGIEPPAACGSPTAAVDAAGRRIGSVLPGPC
ncbi:hypothetical protein [Caenispirillum salinarum]|uniref:hypothetical protein n=1 Tax=Caenispirillum salinarum TaxID=859058 RepID=UPI0038517966